MGRSLPGRCGGESKLWAGVRLSPAYSPGFSGEVESLPVPVARKRKLANVTRAVTHPGDSQHAENPRRSPHPGGLPASPVGNEAEKRGGKATRSPQTPLAVGAALRTRRSTLGERFGERARPASGERGEAQWSSRTKRIERAARTSEGRSGCSPWARRPGSSWRLTGFWLLRIVLAPRCLPTRSPP